jgi:hypothetical protein
MAAQIVQTIAEATLSASPRADASNALGQGLANGIASQLYERMNIWTTLLTVLLMLVAWDQCKWIGYPMVCGQSLSSLDVQTDTSFKKAASWVLV